MSEAKIIYKDTNQIAYEKNGVRYSVIHAGGRVQVTEVTREGKVADYIFELDDAIAALSCGTEADIAEEFVRRLKRKRGAQLFWGSLRVLLKLISHIIVAGILAFAAGVVVQKFWRIL